MKYMKLFKFVPRQRQLSSDERKDVENMLKVQANKKMVQHYIMEKTGEKVGLKDLHNIQTDRKKKMVTSAKSEIEQVYDIFSSGCDEAVVEYVTQDKAIFFQDKQMRSAFEHYPEVILVDSTYKTNNLRMPLYFIISVDGQGQSEIVAVFLLTHEEESLLIALKSLRTERDLKTVGMFQKKAVAPCPKESPEYKYRELVTPYA
jgi:zinc finger SWIM domain-containing protein 3